MNNILLVITDYNSQEENNQNNQGKIMLMLDKIFYKKRIINSINSSFKQISSESSSNVFILKIPQIYLEQNFYGKKGLEKAYNAKNIVVNAINYFCSEEKVERHFYSKQLLELYQAEIRTKLYSEILAYEKQELRQSEYTLCNLGMDLLQSKNYEYHMDPENLGKTLFRSLNLQILKQICDYTKKNLIYLNIAIVGNKENKEDVFKILWKLALQAKYITVLTNDEDILWLENEIEEIYNATGLAINISKNFNQALKNIDIVINYGNLYCLSTCRGLRHHTIIIDNSLYYYSQQKEKVRITNPIINKIEVILPRHFPNELKGLAPEHFGTDQLAEIIIGNKNKWVEEKIEEEFIDEGYSIRRLPGFN